MPEPWLASVLAWTVAAMASSAGMAATVTDCVHNASELESALAAASAAGNTDAHVVHVRAGTYLAPSGGFFFNQNSNYRLDLEGGFIGLNGGTGCDLQLQSAAATILDGRGGQPVFRVISNGATSGNITFRYFTFRNGGGDAEAFRVVMLSNASTLRVENSLFIDNSTVDTTVDIQNMLGLTYFLDNAVVANTVAAGLGQNAVRIESGSGAGIAAYINDNTIAGNIDSNGVGLSSSLAFVGGANFDFANNIVWNSDFCDITAFSQSGDPLPAVNYDDNDIDSACVAVPPPGTGTMQIDPRFIDAATGNFRLRPDSPVRDAGDDTPPGTTRNIDLDGLPRLVGRVDMGAYEVPDRIFGDGFGN